MSVISGWMVLWLLVSQYRDKGGIKDGGKAGEGMIVCI